MLDEFLRQRGVRDQIEIVYTYPTISQLVRNCLFLQRPTGEVLPSIFDSKDIKYRRGFTLASVDSERKVAISEEGQEEDFDILMQTPPIQSGGRRYQFRRLRSFQRRGLAAYGPRIITAT